VAVSLPLAPRERGGEWRTAKPPTGIKRERREVGRGSKPPLAPKRERR
jgi:hypothetical protein